MKSLISGASAAPGLAPQALAHFHHLGRRPTDKPRRTPFGVTIALALAFVPAAPSLSRCQVLETYVDPSPRILAEFGTSVTAVGNNVLVGGQYSNAYLFSSTTGSVLQTYQSPNSNDFFGTSTAAAGNYVFIGAPGDSTKAPQAGAVDIFNTTTGNFLGSIYSPTPVDSAEFGYSVAAQGNEVLVGGFLGNYQANATVDLFDSSGNLLLAIADPRHGVADGFGQQVAFVGNNILVAAPDKNGGPGAVYLFNGTTGNLMLTLTDPESGSNWFGYSVAAVGNNILVGAPHDSTMGTNAGAAYLFDGSTGSLIQSIFNSAANSSAGFFGAEVGSAYGGLLVGAPNYQTANDGGAILEFSEASGALLGAIKNPHPTENTGYAEGPGPFATVGSNFAAGAQYASINQPDEAGVAYLFYLPEPSTGTLLVLGLIPLAGWGWRRRGPHGVHRN